MRSRVVQANSRTLEKKSDQQMKLKLDWIPFAVLALALIVVSVMVADRLYLVMRPVRPGDVFVFVDEDPFQAGNYTNTVLAVSNSYALVHRAWASGMTSTNSMALWRFRHLMKLEAKP